MSATSVPANNLRSKVEVDRFSEGEWNTLLSRFSDASLYQSWAYGAVSWGEHRLSHIVLQREGQPVALAQLRIVQVPLLNRGVAYLRAGPVCVLHGSAWDRSVFEEMSQALVQEYACRRRLLLRIIPHQFQQDETSEAVRSVWGRLGLQPDPAFKAYRTFRLDLQPALEILRRRQEQKWRNQLNSAERNGLTISEGTSEALYQQFLELYRDMMARKNFESAVDPEVFRLIQQRLPEDQKMLILISLKDGRPTAGLVGSALGGTGVYLLGATSTEGMKSKGSYLLQWRMVQLLKARGCHFYDLGGINPVSNPGVYHFKSGIGGEEVCALGRFNHTTDFLSSITVAAGEKIRGAFSRWKSWISGRRSCAKGAVPA